MEGAAYLEPVESLLRGEAGYLRPEAVSSVGDTQLLHVKAGVTVCFGAVVDNNNAAAMFLLAFDSVSAPANGAVPVTVVRIPATTTGFVDYGIHGRVFRSGCWLAQSSTRDTLTLAGPDFWLDVTYL